MRRYGNVRLLPSGRYQVRIRPRNGVYLTAPRTFDSEQEAQAWLNAMERKRDAEDNWTKNGLTPPASIEKADIHAQ